MANHDDPRSRRDTRAPRRKSRAPRLAGAVLGVVLTAAAVTGGGMYLQREAPEWQRFWGTGPVLEPTPEPGDGLAEILATARLIAASPAPGTSPAVVAELGTTATLLESHVALLTPGEPEATAPAAATPTTGSVPAPPAPSPAEFAATLARFGVHLIDAAQDADPRDYRALSGAGMEQVLAARALARSAGTQAQAEALELPYAGAGFPTRPGFTAIGCPPPSPGTETGSGPEPDGAAVGAAADAAYRLAYAYDVAGARLTGDARVGAWKLEGEKLDLAHGLESTLDCEAIREPAYQLPKDFDAAPLAATATGLEQLALLLRDAAATGAGESRAWLGHAAWEAALTARQATGRIPSLTSID